jgi:uncharacterized protein (TIGR03086 family)
MDVDLPEVHARALDATHRYVAGVAPDQWGLQSVCAEWTVRELVNHIVTGNYWAYELGGGKSIEEVGDVLDGDVLGSDPSRAYDDSALVAAAVFREPGAMERPCAVSYGPVPGSVYCGHRLIEAVIHGWDIAKSTDQDTTLDPELVEAVWIVGEPQIDLLAPSGMFGVTRTVPDDADRQTKVLAILGRQA